jgi:hypothetical protein
MRLWGFVCTGTRSGMMMRFRDAGIMWHCVPEF